MLLLLLYIIFKIDAVWDAIFLNAILTAKTIQHNTDLLLGAILPTGLAFDVFNNALR